MKKVAISLVMLGRILGFSVPAILAGEGKIGGNLKLYLWDQSGGTSNGDVRDDRGTPGISSLYMYISRELNEKVSIDVQPTISVSTRATPRIGTKIGAQRTATSVSVGFVKAYLKCLLPYNVEISAGVIRPLFTEDYGAQLFYEEELHGNCASANSRLGEWKDFGAELYKVFEVENVSIPAYLYFLNGNNYATDDNNAKMVMFHLAPEVNLGNFGGLKVMGSIATGMYDTNTVPIKPVIRYSAGLAYTWRNLWVRGEYMNGTWSSWTEGKGWTDGVARDILTNGYYVKVGYNITPKLRIIVDRAVSVYNYYQDAAGKYVQSPETTMQWIPSINYFITEDSILIFQYIIHDAWRDDGNASLHYSRGTLGWRTTF